MTYGMMMGDAIANHILEIDARLRKVGHSTAIYSQHIAPEMKGRVRNDHEFLPHMNKADALLIYHYSIYTPNIRYCLGARCKRLLIYHNITPGEFFRHWDPAQAILCELGRRALASLTCCDLALGDSEYNRQELLDAGYDPARTGVLPIFLSQKDRGGVCRREPEGRGAPREGKVRWLTVGRVVPNKAIEDIIRTFFVYQRYVNPNSHLNIVGSRYVPSYDAALDQLVSNLGMNNYVTFAGRISDAELISYYNAADLYFIASRHEGFCVPVIESMHFGVPILARKAAATPETLGGSGVLFTSLGYEVVAEMAHLMIKDCELREAILRGQERRLRHFAPERIEETLRQYLGELGVPV